MNERIFSPSEPDPLEAMLRSLTAPGAESFAPGFATRVSAMAVSRMRESSRQFEAFENLKSAFFGTAMACAAACLVLFLWIHLHPNSNETAPNGQAPSVENDLQNVTDQSVEEML